MKKTAIVSLLVGFMALPALARDDYRMGLGTAAPRHDSALGAIHSEGVTASLSYMAPKTGDGVTGLNGQYGQKMWGVGLEIPNLDSSDVMNVYGGYSFGEFEAGLNYKTSDPALITILGRYMFGAGAVALAYESEQKVMMLGYAHDIQDFTVALDYVKVDTADGTFNLNAGYYSANLFGALYLTNITSEGTDMTTALEVGYGQDMWHASLKYDVDAESTMLHGAYHF